MNKKLFTSESVSEGHPDKLCDQISDAVLDEFLRKDPESRVACECFTSTSFVLVGGEVTSAADFVDVENIARNVVRDVGYTKPEYGIDADSMAVMSMIHKQSADIAQGVEGRGLQEFIGEQGAGDQGMMFGYACDETEELMPLPIMLSHKLMQRATTFRKNEGGDNTLRPDAKSQVTVEYDDEGNPCHIDTIVISHQHHDNIDYKVLCDVLYTNVIKSVLEPTGLFDDRTQVYINPTGRFVIGGPFGDTGLTGRKIIVDTYGGMGRHGGGAFSGKDPSKVDRSAAYAARWVAKSIVAAKLAKRCEVQLSYAIGVPKPVSVRVDTFGTSELNEAELVNMILNNFDLTPRGIIQDLDLKRPIYRATSTLGHFGKNIFSWESVQELK